MLHVIDYLDTESPLHARTRHCQTVVCTLMADEGKDRSGLESVPYADAVTLNAEGLRPRVYRVGWHALRLHLPPCRATVAEVQVAHCRDSCEPCHWALGVVLTRRVPHTESHYTYSGVVNLLEAQFRRTCPRFLRALGSSLPSHGWLRPAHLL